MDANTLQLIGAAVKLAFDIFEKAQQLEKQGIVVPGLDDVRARLQKLKDSPPLPEK